MLCDNTGIKCAAKGAIYSATCLDCVETNRDPMADVPTYIGETSRPWRERIKEHVDGMKNYRKNSVFLEHWMLVHGTSMTCPRFKFKLIGTYPDPLRRQICEALNIIDIGSLNRKSEFNINELCYLEAKEKSKDIEARVKSELELRKRIKDDMKPFIELVQRVNKRTCVSDQNNKKNKIFSHCYRLKRQQQIPDLPQHPKKRQRMETSTPTSFKCGYRDNDSDTSLSPIPVMNEPGNVGSCLIDHNLGEEKTNLIDSGNGDINTSDRGDCCNTSGPTGLSTDVDKIQLTPPITESSSLEEKKVTYQTICFEHAMVNNGIIRRTSSLPNIAGKTYQNAYGRGFTLNMRKMSGGLTFGGWRGEKQHRRNSTGDLSFELSTWSMDKEDDVAPAGHNSTSVNDIEKCLDKLEVREPSDNLNCDGLRDVEPEPVATSEHEFILGCRGEDHVVSQSVSDESNGGNNVLSQGKPDALSNDDFGGVVHVVSQSVPDESNGGNHVVSQGVPDALLNDNFGGNNVVDELKPHTPKPSSVTLGLNASSEILAQNPINRSKSRKRSIQLSPEGAPLRPRKISVCDYMMSPTSNHPSVAEKTPRRNTWGSAKGRNKSKKNEMVDLTKQKLITQLFKQNVERVAKGDGLEEQVVDGLKPSQE